MNLSAPAVALLATIVGTGCGTWFDNDDFLPSSPTVIGALTLTAPQPTVEANGFATVPVVATITADAALANRTIVFETTAGTFPGTGTPEKTTIEKTVDGAGSAAVELRSSHSVETARVTARVKDVAGLSREVLVSFTAAAPDSIITVTAPATAPADGATITQVTAQIAAGLPGGRRGITFSTTLGTFVGDPSNEDDTGKPSVVVDADGGNRAVAYLRSPSNAVGTAFVTAKVDTPAVSASTSVGITRAVPQQILVTTSVPIVSANFTTSITVTATLVRDPGVATLDTVVTFRAVDSQDMERGLFTQVIRTNAAGVATAEFSAGTFAAQGPMVITATAVGVSGSTTVQVVP